MSAACRRFMFLLVATALVLAACDTGGGDEAGPTETAKPKLTAPTGFTATPEGFTVTLSWTPPSGGPEVDGYDVYRDGSKLQSVAAAETTFTDDRVTPGKAYTYEIRARSKAQMSPAASADVEIKVPPLSAARVEGDFSVVTRVVSKSGYSRFEDKSSYGWHFAPKCGKGPCNVLWKDVFQKRIRALLKRTKGRYAGEYHGLYLTKCGGTTSVSTVNLALKVAKARAVAGEWRATRLTGTLTNSETAQFGCVSSRAQHSVVAKVRLAG